MASQQMFYGGTQKCSVSLANYLRAVADALCLLRTYRWYLSDTDEPHEGEVPI